jgi:DNA-directed RNA polymerase beta subunit
MKTVTKDIPLAIVLRALGIVSDFDIIDCIVNLNKEDQSEGMEEEEEDELKGILEVIRHCLEEASGSHQQEECLAFIGQHIDKLKKADIPTAREYAIRLLM